MYEVPIWLSIRKILLSLADLNGCDGVAAED